MTNADDLIARALSGATPWPADIDADTVAKRAFYHGVSGLLTARSAHLTNWPSDLCNRLRAEAVAQTMWEMRHRVILTSLLAAMDQAGIGTVVLKGTALAYGLYPEPAQRKRGDTDLLVAPEDLESARAVLSAAGFACANPITKTAAPVRQEGWATETAGSGRHEIDLHVEVFSSTALMPVLRGSMALSSVVDLPQLSPNARVLPLPLALLQACVHRAQHKVSPYFVNGKEYYGGDRLIWLMDIDLAMRALSPRECDSFLKAAIEGGVAPVCAAALHSAAALLDTPCPADLLQALEGAPSGPAASYLTRERKSGRVFDDIRAIPGIQGKVQHAFLRLFPPASILRARYPDLAHATRPRLYLRRLSGIFIRRGVDRT